MKTFRTLLAAAAVVGAPGLAIAQDCGMMKERQTTMSCAPGSTLDVSTGQCVAEITS